RDLKAFSELGHVAIGLEGAAELAAMARAHSGCEVWQQDFLRLDLPERYFDGVFANAALFHVPSQELPRVLQELHAALKPRGVLFCSNPRGRNEEGWAGGRYGVYFDLETWRRHANDAGFVELTHYYRPTGLPRERQPWLASAWRAETPRSLQPAARSRPSLTLRGLSESARRSFSVDGRHAGSFPDIASLIRATTPRSWPRSRQHNPFNRLLADEPMNHGREHAEPDRYPPDQVVIA